MTFVIYFKDGSKTTEYVDCYDSNEQDIDAAYDYLYSSYDDIEYIEMV